MSCPHRPAPWTPGKYEPDGRHGPERTRDVTGAVVLRSWTHCLDCGMRLEMAVIDVDDDVNARNTRKKASRGIR